MKHEKYFRTHECSWAAVALSAAIALGLPAMLQAEESKAPEDAAKADAAKLEQITVTGTRMKRVDQEDLQPLIIISREQLDASGHTSIADALRDLTQNSFGPTTDRNPLATNGGGSTTVNLHGQGAQYTLVLLNGIPLVGEPSASGGDVQNLNVLPWAAVDRIEILNDGASAVYGSKAIGGVINIITRQNFTGAAFTGQINRPTRGGAESDTGSAIAGFHNDSSQGFLSLEYSKSDPLFAHERSFLPPQFSLFSAPPNWRRNDPTGLANRAWYPGANCPAAIGTDPRYPDSQLSPVYGDGSQYCMYNFIADMAERSALERKSLLTQGSTRIGDSFNAHALLLVTRNNARSELAPAPSGLLPRAIAADNPFNPTLGEVAPGLGYALDLRYRPLPAGRRIINGQDDVQQLTAGMGGSRIGGWSADWNVDVTGTHYGQQSKGRNFASVSRFLAAIAGGTFNPFADPETQDFSQFAATMNNTASHRTRGITAQVQPQPFSMFGIALDLLVGVDYNHESFSQRDDAAAIDGDIFGAPGTLAGGNRDYLAVFGELVLNPNGNWQVKAALRRDDYSDAGGALSPKLAAMWKLDDSLLLRASVGKGFHVPDLVVLGGSESSFPLLISDPLGCQLRPDDPIACNSVPREVSFVPNPNLDPETARQVNFGAIYSPLRDFSIGVQAFQTRFRDAITSINQLIVLENDVACYAAGRPCDLYREGLVERDADGQIERILVPSSVNASSSLTRGFDIDLNAAHEFSFGRLDAQLSFSRITHFEQRFPGGIVDQSLGYLGFPRDRANFQLGWQRGAWRASGTARVIGSQRNCEYFDADSDACSQDIPRYTTVDVQAAWNATGKTTFTAGIRNVANREPFINSSNSYSKSLYDVIGRVVYFRIEQRL
jgi:iron complex outermembrane receptor protein